MAATTVEIAKADEYWGHWQGGYELTVADLQRMVANFSAPVVIDYDHATQLAELGSEVPAAGLINRVWVEGDILHGEVDWTERAEGMIDADEYRFLSPVIDPDAADRNTAEPIGAVLETVALTNSPFMDGLDSVRNSMRGGLGRINATTPEALLNSKLSSTDPSSPQPTAETMANPNADTSPSTWESFKRKLSSILNSSSTDELDILDDARQLAKAQKRAESAEEEAKAAKEELQQANERVEELQGQLEEDEEAQEEAEAAKDEEILNSAIEDGKIKKADREEWAGRMAEHRDGTRALLNSIEPGTVVPGAGSGAPKKPNKEEHDNSPSGPARSGFMDYVNGDS